ncbi:10689_t:CDS:2, partial [Gigaspora rosea]
SYIGWALSTKDISAFNSLLLQITISNRFFSFSWIENEETKEFFKFMALASSNPIGITLALDSWKNIRN